MMIIDRQELSVAVTAYVLRWMLEQIDCRWDDYTVY